MRLRDVHGKRVLLLQGPSGPFFERFASDLRDRECEVTRVSFDAGDELHGRDEVVRFRGAAEEWPAACRDLIAQRRIQVIFLFDHEMDLHARAIQVAEDARLPVWAFSEGLLRPQFVTLERVDKRGERLPRDPDVYRRVAAKLPGLPQPTTVKHVAARRAWWSVGDAAARDLDNLRSGSTRGPSKLVEEATQLTRTGVRKIWHGTRERLASDVRGDYFLAIVQAPAQSFLEEVIREHAAHSPAGVTLVIRPDPREQRIDDLDGSVRDLTTRFDCADRVRTLHDAHLPPLLKRARGVITHNSAVGLSALHHGTPVKVTGVAPYDMAGLTSQRSLADFFVTPGKVDRELVGDFTRFIREEHQLEGSFYAFERLGSHCGLNLAPFDREPRQTMKSFPLDMPDGKTTLDITVPTTAFVAQMMEGGLQDYEPETLACFLACLDVAPAGAVLDIGANVGLFAWLAATMGGRQTVAFEPSPEVADWAAEIARQNRLAITVESSALSDREGTAQFYISARSDASSSLSEGFRVAADAIEVPLETVDGYCERHALTPAVLKIDTESTEDAVLRGAHEVLTKHRPWLVCEVLACRGEASLTGAIKDYGYHWYQITDEVPLVKRREIFGDRSGTHRNWLFTPEPPPDAFWERMAHWKRALEACQAG